MRQPGRSSAAAWSGAQGDLYVLINENCKVKARFSFELDRAVRARELLYPEAAPRKQMGGHMLKVPWSVAVLRDLLPGRSQQMNGEVARHLAGSWAG